MPSDSDIAIRILGLCKSYAIRHEAKRKAESTLAETVLKRLRHPVARSGETETFHALKDVSFDVKKGDVVGVIGRNGAGKSTLLKILSRITEPTSGRIELYGRIGALLEVGTGFHPELTGRENVYLNGGILGMSRREIRKHFDAIVDFADVEKFLDTPVKRYSSGMYVRLAFAVAAHLNSEILIVDEVLAVGDAEFQKKCLGKMRDVSSAGRTVLFVTHNMGVVPRLCSRCLLLSSGAVVKYAATQETISEYMKGTTVGSYWRRGGSSPLVGITIEMVSVVDSRGTERAEYAANESVFVHVQYAVSGPGVYTRIVVEIENELGEVVFASTDCDAQHDGDDQERAAGSFGVRCEIPGNLLAVGNYRVTGAASWTNHVEYDRASRCVGFEILSVGSRSAFDRRPGVIAPILSWSPAAIANAVPYTL